MKKKVLVKEKLVKLIIQMKEELLLNGEEDILQGKKRKPDFDI